MDSKLRILCLTALILATGCGKGAPPLQTTQRTSPTAQIVDGTYLPGQVFHGDAAMFNPATGLYTATQDETIAPDKIGCLNCHYAHGKANYLKTGHKNMLRKVTTGPAWSNADGAPLRTLDTPAFGSLYNSGSTFDWTAGTVVVGAGPLLPHPGPDPINPIPFVGQTKNIFYIFGGWVDPAQLDTIYQGGFTGEQFAAGNYDCAHCHVTGYRVDALGKEPTDARTGFKISDADFSRIPTDYTSGTSSWAQEGITCEKCHLADTGVPGQNHTALPCKTWLGPNNPPGCYNPLPPAGTAVTPLCLQCHRTEIPDTVNNTFNYDLGQYVQDGGGCSDGVTADYNACLAIKGNTWNYAPYLDHSAGLSFLNSPHARFSGTLTQNKLDANDTSVTLTGSYSSHFVTYYGGGCADCHQVHESFTDPKGAPLKHVVDAATGHIKQSGHCTDCHTAYGATLLTKTDHKNTPNTPYGVTAGDKDKSCTVCHMSQGFHFFRINTDPAYSTFPTAGAFYGGQTTANTATDGQLAASVWNDIDITCGQCHVGNGPSFGLAVTPGDPGLGAIAPILSKAVLAQDATCIHHQPLVHIDAGANGVLGQVLHPDGTPVLNGGAAVIPAGIYNPLYSGKEYSPTFTFVPAAGFEVTSIDLDGAVYQTKAQQWSFTNLNDCHHVLVAFSAEPVIAATAHAGGAITPPSITVPTGGSATFSITPNAGFQVQNVVVDGATSAGALTAYTFGNVQGNHTIEAYFTPVAPPPSGTVNITVTALGAGGGTITDSVDANVVTASGSGIETITRGSSITFTFNPAAGFKVGFVTAGAVSIGAVSTYTFNHLEFNDTLTVVFVPQ